MQAIAVSIAAGIAKSTNHCYHKCSFKEADLAVKLAHVLATAYKRVRGNKCTSAPHRRAVPVCACRASASACVRAAQSHCMLLACADTE